MRNWLGMQRNSENASTTAARQRLAIAGPGRESQVFENPLPRRLLRTPARQMQCAQLALNEQSSNARKPCVKLVAETCRDLCDDSHRGACSGNQRARALTRPADASNVLLSSHCETCRAGAHGHVDQRSATPSASRVGKAEGRFRKCRTHVRPKHVKAKFG